MPLPTQTYETVRDAFAQCIMQSTEIAAAGLPSGNVFQADTLDSPSSKPFIVVRWSDETSSLGGSVVQPVDLWVYDEPGDYNRATAIAKAAGAYLGEHVVGLKTQHGVISQIRSLGIGGDLADEGFDAIVVPQHLSVVHRGL